VSEIVDTTPTVLVTGDATPKVLLTRDSAPSVVGDTMIIYPLVATPAIVPLIVPLPYPLSATLFILT
jgi:hypothetical protein